MRRALHAAARGQQGIGMRSAYLLAVALLSCGDVSEDPLSPARQDEVPAAAGKLTLSTPVAATAELDRRDGRRADGAVYTGNLTVTAVPMRGSSEKDMPRPDYWPLEVGNWWSYEHTWYTVVYTDSLGQETWGDTTGEVISEREADQIVSPHGPVYLQTRRGVEPYVVEVIGVERIEARVYYRLTNGQRLAHDEAGNILEYVQLKRDPGPVERVLFDFSTPGEAERQFLTRLPYVIFLPVGAVSLGAPPSPAARSRSVSGAVKAGAFPDIVSFGLSISLAEGYGVSFAAGVGPIMSWRGSDMGYESQTYELIAAQIGGRRIGG